MDRRTQASRQDRAVDRLAGLALFILLFGIYNANGREIGSYDTQPTKFAARELLLRGTLSLNHVVGATPEYANRWGLMLAADGSYRSVYSPVPAVAAAALAWPFWKTGLIDVRAPLAPALMAKVTASALVSLAVVLAFFTSRYWVSRRQAFLLALGLGVGTGFWSTASQTLWQTESAVFGLALAVFAFAVPPSRTMRHRGALIGIGLGLAGATRPQLAPAVAILLVGTWLQSDWRDAAAATCIVTVFVVALCTANLRWFGHVLGALPLLQEVNSRVHGTGASFRLGWQGFVGLLISPNRGLLIYSPVVVVALAGIRPAFAKAEPAIRWCVVALAAQYALYAAYAVWWGGHTYGPRYLIDVLPLAVPPAAIALSTPQFSLLPRFCAAAALAWSILAAATGAFCYPNDRWNVDPSDVDRQHDRLWSLSDNQIRRCWTRGLSPQNFTLLDRATVGIVRR